MAQLTLALFGGFQLASNAEVITTFESNKVRALFAYLAVETNRPHQRAQLAMLLWPDYPEAQARTNLRHVLRQLRQTLGTLLPNNELLSISQNTLQLDPTAADLLVVDVQEFCRLHTDYTACDHANFDQCRDCVERLSQAGEIYQGDFLAGLTLYDSEPFEEWMVIQREQLHRQALEIFYALTTYSLRQNQLENARHYARRQLALEPWREEAHRQLMFALARQGKRTAALAQYNACATILREELGVEPDPATVALYQQIRDRAAESPLSFGTFPQLAGGTTPLPHTLAPARGQQHDWGEVPLSTYFYGREAELSLIQQWFTKEPTQLLIVLGIGGVGKTAIVAHAARQSASSFDAVFWRSLINAPPLTELLPQLFQLLTPQPLIATPDNLEDCLRLLLDLLRQQRCLLILDNLESILQAGAAGQFCPGYADYEQLLARLTQHSHRSTIILTSRERPRVVEQIAEDFPWVRTLALHGLQPEASRSLLRTRGLAANERETNALIDRYSGHPLALKLVARTITELFDGDVTSFLSDEPLIFDDVRSVLDQQFARMTPLEREILIWLAIERESISVNDLAANLLQPPSRRNLLEALNGLQRRSLIEKTATGFTLQNVVTEYVTDYLIEQAVHEIHSGELALLRCHALVKAQSQEHVRQSQLRLILAPIAEQLQRRADAAWFLAHCQQLVNRLREPHPVPPGYAGGNLLNLLLHVRADLRGFDFSQLPIWQVWLSGVDVPELDLRQADLTGSVFSETFGVIHTVAYSPDGQWIMAGTADGELRTWRASDYQPDVVFAAHTGSMRSLAFYPDGARFVSSGDDYTVRIWRERTGHLLHILQGHTGWVRSVTISRDGRFIASAGMDQRICIWRAADGALLHVLEEHTDAVWGVVFSPDPTTPHLLASASADALIHLWDADSGRRLHTLRGHSDEIRCLAFSADGSQLASGSLDRTLRVWQLGLPLTSSQLRHCFQGDEIAVRAVVFSPDGTLLASGGADFVGRVWDLRRGELKFLLRGHIKGINSLAFAPDSRTCISGGDDLTLRAWNLQTGQMRTVLQGHTGWIRALGFRPADPAGRGPTLLATGSDDRFVRLWNVDDGTLHQTLSGHHHWLWSMAFSPTGDYLASGGADHLLHLWRWSASESRYRLQHTLRQHTNTIRSMAFHPAGTLLATGSADSGVRLWEPSSGRLLATLNDHQGWVEALVFSPSGSLLVSAGTDHIIRLWDATQHQLRAQFGDHSATVRAVQFAPHAQPPLLASAGEDGRVLLWEVDEAHGQAKLRHALQGHSKGINAIAFSPDGTLVASAGADDLVCVWQVTSGELRHCLRGHSDWVRSVAFSPDGHLLASCGVDRTIRLWDVQRGEQIQRLHGHKHWVWLLTFSPDGSLLASAGVDESVCIWDVATGRLRYRLRPQGPYAGMKITGATGLTAMQRKTLHLLGAVEEG